MTPTQTNSGDNCSPTRMTDQGRHGCSAENRDCGVEEGGASSTAVEDRTIHPVANKSNLIVNGNIGQGTNCRALKLARDRREEEPVPPIPVTTGNQRRTIIWNELRAHVPFTVLGTVSGVLLLGVLIWAEAPRSLSATLFWTFHPLHVLLSALVTTAMFRRHSGHGLWATLAIGYFGSIGIATLSDSVLPYAGEWLLALPHRGLHLGFIEKWWLVNPLGAVGILAGFAWSHTKFSHAGHVLLSTWASLFHITMALGSAVSLAESTWIALFLFLSVWLPCCTSDIVFPLLFTPGTEDRPATVEDAGPPRL